MSIWLVTYLIIFFQYDFVWCLESCCSDLRQTDELVKCVEGQNRVKWPRARSDVVFATFISESILSYAGYNMLFNGNCFMTRGYDFHVLSNKTGDDYYPLDRRWNKIKAVANGLLTWAKNSSFLVFIDADLVILDPYFDILSVVEKYPTANIIMATDEIDVGNTGFMIVRNVPWSIDFFNRWWAARYTKDTFCDQHVLNRLLLSSLTDRSLVAIAPAKEINSKWPAIENFVPSDPILHLMGETHQTRNAVAKYLAEEYCALVANRDPLAIKPVVIPLTKEKLLDIKQQTITNFWEDSKVKCAAPNATEDDYNMMHENIGHRCDPSKRSVGDAAIFAICERMLREAKEIHHAHLKPQSDTTLQVQSGVLPAEKRIVHLNHVSMLQYDLLELKIANSFITGGTEQSPDVYAAAQQVLSALEDLEDALDMRVLHNHAYIHHKRGMVFLQLCGYHQSSQRWDAVAECAKVSITELNEALKATAQETPQFTAFVKSYIHAAARLAHAYRELRRLDEAKEWANIALTNANILYASTNNEERVRRAQLTDLHLLCRSIYSSLQNVEKVAIHTREINLLN